MNNFHKHNRFIRFTGIVAVIIFGFLSILGSGGGGDDGGDGGGITVGLLPSYDFGINRGYDYTGTESTGMTVTVSSIPIALRVDPHPLAGTVNCDQNTNMCAPSTIKIQTLIDLFDASEPPLIGNLSVTIPEELSIGSSGRPESGTIKITLVPSDPVEYIELKMTTCDGGAGVDISHNGEPLSPVSCFTWDQFEQLVIDESTDQVLVVAVFGYRVIGFLFEQLHFTTEVLSIIGDYAADLEQDIYIEEPCDSFSAAGYVAPPEVVSDPGYRGLSWYDLNPDQSVGPGDSFYASLYDCWVSPDQLLNGYIEFLGYVESINANGQITAIGFTSDTPPTPGGVFPLLSISETEETTPGSGTMEITNVIGVTEGGFSILFNAPAP